jgi:hypothetical protein
MARLGNGPGWGGPANGPGWGGPANGPGRGGPAKHPRKAPEPAAAASGEIASEEPAPPPASAAPSRTGKAIPKAWAFHTQEFNVAVAFWAASGMPGEKT